MDPNVNRIAFRKFNELLPAKRLERFAVKYGLDRKHSIKLSGPLMFLTLLRGLLGNQKVSLRLMASDYAEATGISLDHSAIAKRLSSIKVDYFKDLFDYLSGILKDRINPRSPGPLSVHNVDATIVCISAKICSFGIKRNTNKAGNKRSFVKSVFSLNDGMPNFLHLCKTPSELNDNIALGKTIVDTCVRGHVFVFDSGCDSRDKLLQIHEKGAYFITPHRTQGLGVKRVVWAADNPITPYEAPGPGEPGFIVTSVEECVFETTTQKSRCKKYANMLLAVVHGLRYDRRDGTGWKPLDLMTNLPISPDSKLIGPYSYAEVAQLYGNRWEIETFFKKIKGHLSFDHLLNTSENGIKIMIYMTLITAMLMIWARVVTNAKHGWNIVKFWLEVSCREWIELAIWAHRTPFIERCRGS